MNDIKKRRYKKQIESSLFRVYIHTERKREKERNMFYAFIWDIVRETEMRTVSDL